MASGMILVMILLHFLPRFQKEPGISDLYERLTGKKPTDLKLSLKEKRRYLSSRLPFNTLAFLEIDIILEKPAFEKTLWKR